jgi:origin recognition complex subunit 1
LLRRALSVSASASSGSDSESDNDSAATATAGPSTPKKNGEHEARFAIGDGVAVTVEGGNEGIGMLTALWEEPEDEEEDEEEDEDDAVSRPEPEERGPRMMATVHWFFRKEDLPGVMKNLQLAEVSGSIRAGP